MKSPQLQNLANELTADPLNRNYSAMDDAAAAVSLNTVNRPADRDIGALQTYVLNNAFNPEGARQSAAIWLLVEDVSAGLQTLRSPDDAPSENQIDAANWLLKILNRNPGDTWDFTDANLAVTLSRLVTAQAMSSDDKTEITALSDNQQSRAVELGIGAVTAVNVAAARAL